MSLTPRVHWFVPLFHNTISIVLHFLYHPTKIVHTPSPVSSSALPSTPTTPVLENKAQEPSIHSSSSSFISSISPSSPIKISQNLIPLKSKICDIQSLFLEKNPLVLYYFLNILTYNNHHFYWLGSVVDCLMPKCVKNKVVNCCTIRMVISIRRKQIKQEIIRK